MIASVCRLQLQERACLRSVRQTLVKEMQKGNRLSLDTLGALRHLSRSEVQRKVEESGGVGAS